MLKRIILSTFGLSLPIIGHAASCDVMLIEITNLTQETCVMENLNVISGKYWGVPLKSIMPGQSFYFPSSNGPNIVLNYQCGQRKISLQSHQSDNWFFNNTVTGTVLSSAPKLHANSEVKDPYCGMFSSNSGFINWVITDN